MDTDSGFSPINQKAREILKNTKERWGITWPEMGRFLNWSPSSLKVYISNGRVKVPMPQPLIDIVLQLEGMPNPILDKGHSSDMAVVLKEGRVYLLNLELRTCRYCGRPFAPGHPQQEYCDTYSGKCGLAMRRKRRKNG